MKYLFLFVFILSISLAEAQDCTGNQLAMQYDFLVYDQQDSIYPISYIYCISDSGYNDPYVLSYNNVKFCKSILYKTGRKESMTRADFYKMNDTLWNAVYYYPGGFVKEQGQLLITNDITSYFWVQMVCPHAPYNQYDQQVKLVTSKRKGEWMEFNDKQHSKFVKKEY